MCPVGFGQHLPVDSRIVAQIAASPQMLSEQGGSSRFMAEWGGPATYQQVSQMPAAQRMTYYAIRAGYTDSPGISVATGLDTKQVD